MIVRPSIISTSWHTPFPGWIDSPAALAGGLLYIALGVLPAFLGHPETRLDIIPVDVCARVIVDASLVAPPPPARGPTPIHHAVAGRNLGCRIDGIVAAIQSFFRGRQGVKTLDGFFVGTRQHGQVRRDLVRRALPNGAMRLALGVLGQDRDLRRLARMDDTVAYLNKAFEYFTHHTFDFVSAAPALPPTFNPDEYLAIVCRGIYRFLLKKDDTEVSLAGAMHDDTSMDVRWAFAKPEGNGAVRTLGVGLRKALRRCTEHVTWDRLSFERAVDASAPDSIFILAPSHRSYFDFLLMSYVCFQHPELGIPMPHIAAADDFSRIPLVGNILANAGAFYIPRGTGGEVAEVNEQLHRLAAGRGSLMFFVEGQRSRSRLTLPPKRGLLRGLQAAGRTFTVLPISMAYDRVPEEGALEKELAGGAKPGMSLGAILGWLGDLARDKVHLGRVHISCGTPLVLDGSTDVTALSESIVSELQKNTAATRFHLRTFLASTGLEKKGVTEAWLAQAIERRGGRVLESSLAVDKSPTPALDQSLRNQWMHVFFADAQALYPSDPVIEHHVDRHGWAPLHTGPEPHDPKVKLVVDALFEPVRAAYTLTARTLRSVPSVQALTPKGIVHADPKVVVPMVEDALHFLQQGGFIQPRPDGRPDWGPAAPHLPTLLASWEASRTGDLAS